MSKFFTPELKKKIAKSAKEGALTGLTIGSLAGAAIGAPIYGVGAIANAAICGAIGCGIGAGIGALIPIIKQAKINKQIARDHALALALQGEDLIDDDETEDNNKHIGLSHSSDSEASLANSFENSACKIPTLAKHHLKSEQTKVGKNICGLFNRKKHNDDHSNETSQLQSDEQDTENTECKL